MTRLKLLDEIARCPELTHALDGNGPCAAVVAAQQRPASELHLPEPWVGRIDLAPILFISSNPGFDPNEHYPVASWPADAIRDFAENRFGSGDPPFVRDYKVRVDSTQPVYAARAPQYWVESRNCAAELLEKRPANLRPGRDYAMTEIVHCKSQGNAGMIAAANACAGRYLVRILEHSVACIVVCYGPSWQHTQRLLGVPAAHRAPAFVEGPLSIGALTRTFVFLPQPSSSLPRKPSVALPSELPRLRGILRACPAQGEV